MRGTRFLKAQKLAQKLLKRQKSRFQEKSGTAAAVGGDKKHMQ